MFVSRIPTVILSVIFIGFHVPLASSQSPDIRDCGLVWERDEGRWSVWRATRATTVAVGGYDSNGRFVEGPVDMRSGDFLRIEIDRQRARCIRP